MNKKYIEINELGNPIRTKKLSYKGEVSEFKVYRVPIDLLYFNDENGRIATFMSQYENDNPGHDIKELPLDDYNELIGNYIKKSNTAETFEKTLNDISRKGQLEAGVILDDGRVIDGNRRFTCLRELYKMTSDSKYYYFECVILKSPKNENDRKELRTLELNIQFGEDEKVTYSAIDRLVSIYNDLLGPKKIYNKDEYERKFNFKKSELNKLIEKTKIMIDYLEFIDKRMMFYIARDYKIDGPIQELVTIKTKLNQAEWDEIKPAFYYWFDKNGDITRKVRETVKLYNNDVEKFNEHLNNVIEKEENRKLNELKIKYKNQYSINTTTTLEEDRNDDYQIQEKFSELSFMANTQKVRNKPLESVNLAFNKLKDIDLDIVKRLNEEEISDLKVALDKLEEIIFKLKGNLK